MLNIVLFGAPGCGKGTQAQRLKEKYRLNHISTGEVIRQEIARGTEMGRSMAHYIETGQLAPDELVVGIVTDYMEEHRQGCGNIFDGFPRTQAQAEAFDKLLARHGLEVDQMIYLDVPEEVLVERILLRGRDSGRADDASEQLIRDRIETYRRQTAIVADHYAAKGKYAVVNGVGTMDEVLERISTVIDDM